MLCVVITVQVYIRMKIQVLPMYSPTPEEVANPDAFANNVRAAMALANGDTTFELSNFDGLLYADGYGKGMLDVLKMKPLARMGYYDYTYVDNKFEMIIGGDNKALLAGLEGSPDKAKTAFGS